MRHGYLLVGLLCACGARSAADSIYDEPSGAGGAANRGGTSSAGSSSGGYAVGGVATGGQGDGGAQTFGGTGSAGKASGGNTSRGGTGSGGSALGGSGSGGTGSGGRGAGGAGSGGKGSGGSTVGDTTACTSMCSSIFSACPVPNSDTERCSAGCVGDLSQLSDRCHDLQRRAMTCVDSALSSPSASCNTLATVLTSSCRRELVRSATCR